MKGEKLSSTAVIGRAEEDGRRWEFVYQREVEQWGNAVWIGEEMPVEGGDFWLEETL